MEIQSFKPVIGEGAKILILGSIPGVISLEKHQYYGNGRNQFWKIIYEILGCQFQEDYERRLEFLIENKIALWDVIGECEREGSLDSKIRNPKLNDFKGLFDEYTGIEHILLNGTKAYDMFTKNIDAALIDGKKVYKMKSTSPANAIKYQKKLEDWSILKEIIELR